MEFLITALLVTVIMISELTQENRMQPNRSAHIGLQASKQKRSRST